MLWWNNVSPDLLRFKGLHLHFSKEFPTEYRPLYSQSSSAIMNMKYTFLLIELMLQDVEQGRYDKVVGKLEVRLQEQTKAYHESQRLMKSLQ